MGREAAQRTSTTTSARTGHRLTTSSGTAHTAYPNSTLYPNTLGDDPEDRERGEPAQKSAHESVAPSIRPAELEREADAEQDPEHHVEPAVEEQPGQVVNTTHERRWRVAGGFGRVVVEMHDVHAEERDAPEHARTSMRSDRVCGPAATAGPSSNGCGLIGRQISGA